MNAAKATCTAANARIDLLLAQRGTYRFRYLARLHFLRGSLRGLLCYRPGLRAGCLLAVPDQTAEELTKRSYVPTDARGFERLEVIVATLNRNDRPGIAPGRQHQIHEKPAHPTVSVHVGMDIDEHKVPEYCTNACIGLCSQQLDQLGHRVAHGFGFRRHVLGTADVDLPGAVA